MKLTSATSVKGKIITFEDGKEMIVLSGGLGSNIAPTFEKVDGVWVAMDMMRAMPYVVSAAKQALGMEGEL